MPDVEKVTLHCSFCGKSQYEVEKLIAGPKVCICIECAERSVEVAREIGDGCYPGSKKPNYTVTSRLLSDINDSGDLTVQAMFAAMTGAADAPIPEGFGGRSIMELLQPVLKLVDEWAYNRGQRRLAQTEMDAIDEEIRQARSSAENKKKGIDEELGAALAALEEKRRTVAASQNTPTALVAT